MSHYHGIDDECENSEYDTDQCARKKRLYAIIVSDALHDVPQFFRVEKRDREPHQFIQVVGYESNADAGRDMQGKPSLN